MARLGAKDKKSASQVGHELSEHNSNWSLLLQKLTDLRHQQSSASAQGLNDTLRPSQGLGNTGSIEIFGAASDMISEGDRLNSAESDRTGEAEISQQPEVRK